jgi:predicted DNA-binding transcriptional regulator AlpA
MAEKHAFSKPVIVREVPIRMNKLMEITGYSRSYIYKLVHWKKTPYRKPTNGRLFFYESEILDFISRNKQATDYEVSDRADAILNREACCKNTRRSYCCGYEWFKTITADYAESGMGQKPAREKVSSSMND